MDNFSGFNMLPPAMAFYLTSDLVARDAFLGLDDDGQRDFLEYAKEFQSKEELERYLYHHNEDNFR